MKTIRCGRVDLNVLDQGAGRPVLLVHGFPLDHRMWRRQVEALSPTYRVIAPDLRGFGGSGGTAGTVTMEDFADDLNLLLDGLEVAEPVTFCGLSMGGYIAWQFWKKYPARLRSLVLADTRAAADTPEAARKRHETAQRVLAKGVEEVAKDMVPKLFAKGTLERQPELVESVRQVMLATSPEGVAAALSGMAVRPDFTGELGRIEVPTLVLVGAEDAICPPKEMRSIADAIQGARYVELAEAGHMSPLENADAFNAALEEFLPL